MQHFLSTEDWPREQLQRLLTQAAALKQNPIQSQLHGKSIALIFMNPSLRTRTSFDIGMQQLGGIAVVLEPGKGAWGIEFEPNVVMDGDAEEHIAEVAGVLSSFCDLIAIRAFPKGENWEKERCDQALHALSRYASVPVINMETIVHPCQELALMQTLQESMGPVQNKKMLIAWTWHPKPLNTAVANSAVLISTKFGMDVTLLCPSENYLLDQHYLETAETYAKASGGSFNVSYNIDQAYAGADVVYAKSWGSLHYYGQPESEIEHRQSLKHFTVDQEKMALTNNALFSHCLPLRRNIQATDAVMDSANCVALEEAGNRLHVQKSVMLSLLGKSL